MLLIFDPPLIQLTNCDQKTMGVLFAELARISSAGLHFVVIGRKTCDWALLQLDLSGREKSQITRLKQSYTQSGGIIGIAKCALTIDVEGKELIETAPSFFSIGVEKFLNSEYTKESVLLVEHIENDGLFYEHIFESLRKLVAIKYHKVDIKNGGGTTIVACLRDEIAKNRAVVCLLDSDKYSPSDTQSSTAKKACKTAAKQVYVGSVMETVGREIENFIPLSIYQDHLFPDYGHYPLLHQLLDKQDIECFGDCLWLFFDIKQGLDGNALAQKTLSPETIEWIEKKFSSGKQELKDIQIPSIGNATMSQFNALGASKSSFHRFMRSRYWLDHFQNFFIHLYWFFVAEKPRSSV